MDEFAGLVAVVTGGASGIGAATAAELARRGATVAVIDRVLPSEVARVHGEVADITDDVQVRAAIAAIGERLGGIDILVNNAGIGAAGDVSANDDAEWHRVYDVNVVGPTRVTRAALPWLKRSDAASVVNTASIVALAGLPNRALYSATKGAVVALTYAMAADHLADGIRVNAVAPGTADTPWVQRLLSEADDPAAMAENLRRRQPLGRLVTADEIAFAIANLASPRAAATTGTVAVVDGGLTSLRV
ncbi:NAD(P)-dependent dehydrogenase (short-subunit alcohol dehydrogenase family) [Microbacterium terrae]|uniref:2-(S)-hydroxypropyl-CoM dehydrogenase n=1 Tax=Microbacterium terrae TaxID=69369 RepID=A0A0M2GV14_9MICO|nr:SDR family oxidoreductase [Microbacterium terrae]KJL37531.1 2-(S)-hydroxypropyl-CoM dehydrogenase [Microbacterium terrae]MBP1076360.1 NAD(P)-dependent dehydrogenase (short-subunit alcohol dehydrogenase family) [Microbacterium terrae]GLJ97184.1 short-chain dehydrogenase [Microbacterium terrae]